MATALPFAATPANILAGFRCAGIHPFNREIFTDQDFSPSAVTDRPDPSSAVSVVSPPCDCPGSAHPAGSVAEGPSSFTTVSVFSSICLSQVLHNHLITVICKTTYNLKFCNCDSSTLLYMVAYDLLDHLVLLMNVHRRASTLLRVLSLQHMIAPVLHVPLTVLLKDQPQVLPL